MVSHGPLCTLKTLLPGGWMGKSSQRCGREKVVSMSTLQSRQRTVLPGLPLNAGKTSCTRQDQHFWDNELINSL